MRNLRVLALIPILLAVYTAQLIFAQGRPSHWLPEPLLAALPGLETTVRRTSIDLIFTAIWTATAAGLAFGILAPEWRRVIQARPASRTVAQAAPASRRWAVIAMIGAIVLAAFTAGLTAPWLLPWDPVGSLAGFGWLTAIAAVLIAAILARRGAPAPHATAQPERSWPVLLVILGIVVLLYGWPMTSALPAIDTYTASMGLEINAILDGQPAAQRQPDGIGLPPTYALTALAALLARSMWAGLQIAGLSTALVTIGATWLVGCELFRREPPGQVAGNLPKNDGRGLALLAAAALAVNYALLHFGRLPIYLEPVAWGCLGLWALLRGLRTNATLAYAASGLALGLAVLLSPLGLVPLLAAGAWWIGAVIFQRSWRAKAALAEPLDRMGGLLWLTAVVVAIAPLAGRGLRETFLWPGPLLAALGAPERAVWSPMTGFLAAWPDRLWRSAMAANLYSDAGTLVGFPGPLLDGILGPLYMLAVGALVFHLDRLVGFALASWLAVGVILASLPPVDAPDWLLLLPMLPAIALATAFAVDRLAAILLDGAGHWLAHALVYLVTGLLIWVALANWLTYGDAERAGQTPPAVAHAVRSSGQRPALILVTEAADGPASWDDPVLRLAVIEARPDQGRWVATPDNWPSGLPPGARLFVQPANSTLLALVQGRYPGGSLAVWRDRRANPIFYVYDLPSAAGP